MALSATSLDSLADFAQHGIMSVQLEQVEIGSNSPYLQSCAKKYKNLVFRPKMAIFWRVGMREGEFPLPLAFQY